MNMRTKTLAGALLLAAACVPAKAATYSDNYTADPTTLTCGYFITIEICTGGQLFNGSDPNAPTPRYLNAGDELTETVTYTSPVFANGSSVENTFYISLPDINAVPGDSVAGNNIATVNSTLQGYSGPPNPYGGPYSAGFLHEYLANVGFDVYFPNGSTPNSGFSATGMTAHFTIVNGDPSPIYGAYYGTGVVLSAAPQLLNGMAGGTVGHPALLPTGLVGAISSSIGGASDASHTEFYQFNWYAGAGASLFQAKGTITDADPEDSFDFELFRIGDDEPIEDLVLNDANAFTQTMSVELASGAYVIGMKTDTPIDPEFTIAFDTPVGTISAEAPEPPTAALLAGVLIGFSPFAVRRKRRSIADAAAA